MTTDLEVVVAPGAVLGEGPCWDDRRHELLWVDIERGRVHFDALNRRERATVDVDGPVSVVIPRAESGYVVATRDGLAFVDDGRTAVEPFLFLEPGDETRMNDGKCDPLGRLWVGSMSTKRQPNTGSLYRVETGRDPVRVLTGVTTSNGLGWSLDGAVMYYVDTGTGGVDVFSYDLETGEAAERGRFVDVAPEDGKPDGLTVDAEGHLWVALWGGWAVRRYAPDGALDRVLRIPAAQVTSCCFGGPDLDVLYITTAARGVQAGEQPMAGAVFALRPDVRGLPAARFAG